MARPSQRGDAFAFRLFLGVALTILVTGFGAYTLIHQRVRAQSESASAAALRAAVKQVAGKGKKDRPSKAELKRLVERLSHKTGVVGAAAFAFGGKRIAGRLDSAVSVSGRIEVRASAGSGPRAPTVVVQKDIPALDSFLTAVRSSMMMMALPAILVSLLVFWLLSGRVLHRKHRTALERAMLDGLTDLGNHRAFQDELRRAAALASRSNLDFALAVFDVDDFKFMNDRRGHAHGDDVLRHVAQILSSGRAPDRAFRIGGDEFALLMPGTGEGDAIQAARRIRSLMHKAKIGVSCGLSATRDGMREAAVLREEADAALYEAKRNRADHPVGYSEVSGRSVILTPEKAHGLRLLMKDGAMDVALQPIWDLDSKTLVGLEGLARPHSDYGLNGPAEAFDVAEQTGRIGELDRLCITRILERGVELPPGTCLFINVHPASLEDAGVDWLFDAVRGHGLLPEQVVIEVTERSGARLLAVVRAVERLRERGLRVALDDVGAGNSGLEMLHSVPVDFVKIDRAIVQRAATETTARAVLAAIIAFADTTGTYVIAEGIEDAGLLAFLRGVEVHTTTGIRGGQGYGLGRPAPTAAAAIAGGAALNAPPEPVPAPPAPQPEPAFVATTSEAVQVVQPDVLEKLPGLDVQVGKAA
jgi:diguanylate cyclase (GGDEF)-like protein